MRRAIEGARRGGGGRRAGVGGGRALGRPVRGAPRCGTCFGAAWAPRPAARLAGADDVSRFAEDLPNVRFLRFTPAGRPAGEPAALGPAWCASSRTATATAARTGGARCVDGLEPAARPRPPRRLALRGGDRRDRPRCASTPRRGRRRARFERVVTGLPGGGNHWTRTLRFGPDGWMYVSIGSTLQRVRRGGPAPGGADALPAGRLRRGGLRDGPAQLGRLRLAARGRADLRDGQRPRPARRRLPALRAEPRGAGRLLRLAVRERRPRARPGLREGAGEPDRRVDPARPRLPRAQRAARHRRSCGARACPRRTAARRSSRSTAPGTARGRTATRSSRCTGARTGGSRSGTS